MPEPKISDPVIDEIREIRNQISEKFDHDTNKLIAHYIELQKQYQDRLLTAPRSHTTKDEHAA